MKKKKIKYKLGDVFELKLPNNKFAYGRIYKNCVKFYKEISEIPNNPPIGSRNFLFNINFQTGYVEDGVCPLVGEDPFKEEDIWGPPTVTLARQILHRGEIVGKVSKEEMKNYEIAKVWGIDSTVKRIMDIVDKDFGYEIPKKKYLKEDEGHETFFDEDVAFDVKKEFDELLEQKISKEEMKKRLLKSFVSELSFPDDGANVIVALAYLFHENGFPDEDLTQQALKIIDNEIGLERWKDAGGKQLQDRKKELKKIKDTLLKSN